MLDITITGLAQAISTFDQAERGLANLAPLMRRIAQVLHSNVQQRFSLEVDPDGRSWAPHAAPTTTNKILFDTGLMLSTLLAESDAHSATISIDTPYAIDHENGTSRLPRRPMLTFDGVLGSMDSASITSELESYINDLFN